MKDILKNVFVIQHMEDGHTVEELIKQEEFKAEKIPFHNWEDYKKLILEYDGLDLENFEIVVQYMESNWEDDIYPEEPTIESRGSMNEILNDINYGIVKRILREHGMADVDAGEVIRELKDEGIIMQF